MKSPKFQAGIAKINAGQMSQEFTSMATALGSLVKSFFM
jgi:hypothetical protein